MCLGPKRDEVTREWRRLHNEEFYTKYYSDDKIKRNKMDRECSVYGGKRDAYKVLVGYLKERSTLGIHWRRWMDDNKMDRRTVGSGGMDWIGLAQGSNGCLAVVNAVTNLLVS
jgi:hypothetical protein